LGLSPARYADLNLHWWMGGADIEYLRPLLYGETVTVQVCTQVASREACLKTIDFIESASGKPAARAEALFTLLERESLLPTKLPDEIAAALFPGRDLARSPMGMNFPTAPAPPPGVIKTCSTAQNGSIDGYLNQAVLLSSAGECGWQAIAHHNWPVERMVAEKTAILVRRNQIEYLAPIKGGEDIEISTWISDVKRSTALRHYRIQRVSDGRVLSNIHALGVWVNLQSGLPVRFSKQFLEDFQPNIAQE
jgi:acyl-CoA thioesterase FadM